MRSEEDVLIPEVVDEEVALTRKIESREKSFLERSESMADALAIFEQRANLLAKAHTIGIAHTRPEDWILTKDKQGNVIGMLAGAGADQVAEVYGIQITNIRPNKDGMFAPEKIPVEGKPNTFTLRAWCDARSNVTGRFIEGLEASRRSDEQFTGRGVDAKGEFAFGEKSTGALESDLRAALQTLLRTKAVRVLCGMSKLPESELIKAGLDTKKCRFGSGFGSSEHRQAAASGDPASAASAEKLWKEILRRTAGDEDLAHEVLRDITKYPEYKKKDGTMGKAWAGAKTFADLNTPERVAKAADKLLIHETFGDAALHQKDRED